MKFFPNRTTFLAIGPLTIQWYAVLILIGAFIAYYFIQRNFKKMGYESDDADNLFIGSLLFGILGARIWYVLFSDLGAYLSDPISIIKIWEGGLAIQGGFIAGCLFAYLYCKRERLNFFRAVDAVVPYVLIAQAVGRWGNFVNQEAFGRAVSADYFNNWPSILNFIKDSMFINGEYHEPTFLYESVLCLIGFGLIMLYKHYSKPKRGDLGFAYLLWYGAIRFWIESSRTDSLMFMGLKMAQILSIIYIVIGVAGLLGLFKKFTKAKKPILLFDLDETLINSGPIISKSFIYVFKQKKPDYTLSEEEIDSFIGPSLEDTFNKYFPENEVNECVEMYRKYNEELHKELKPFPNTASYLDQLKSAGYIIGVVSAKRHDTVELGLKQCHLDDKISFVLGGDEYTKSKPDKEGIIKACAKMKVSHDDCIYVGDSVCDVEAAKNAGVYAVAFVSNPKREEKLRNAKPNLVIKDLQELQTALDKNISWTYYEV